MAIVKLKYTRGKGTIKAHLRYIVHRPGKERERLTRELFGHNYLPVTKQYAYDLINAAPKGTVFYKMTINFHPVKEDTHKDLEAVRKLMSNKSTSYKSLKVWQATNYPVSPFLALPRI